MRKNNLIGQKFGKLTVISASSNIKSKNNKGRSYAAWNCVCECGTILIIRSGTLTSGDQKSCGCAIANYGVALSPGQKFNKLTTISYSEGFWNCKCECGNLTTTKTHHLISGNTKSCGCLKVEAIKKNQKLSLKINTKYPPNIATARRLWKHNYHQNKICDITFDDWMTISQQNCNYCGAVPSNTYNYFTKRKGASQNAKNDGYFIYNGIDRIDSSLPHIMSNVVSCCWICNRAKSNRKIENFYNYIDNLKINNFKILEPLLVLPQNYLLTSIKGTYRHYTRNYKTIEIDLSIFYTLSQLPCNYCGEEKSNYFNVYLKDKRMSQSAKDGAHFYYNGIDRIDNNKTHTLDNVVPCCKWCNFAKSNLSLLEFQNWIQRIQTFQKQKELTFRSAL